MFLNSFVMEHFSAYECVGALGLSNKVDKVVEKKNKQKIAQIFKETIFVWIV